MNQKLEENDRRMRGKLQGLLWSAIALCVLLPGAAAAQQRADDPLTGHRVRITAPLWVAERVTGEVTTFTHEALVLRAETSGEEIQIPLRSIQRLDRFEGDGRALNARHRALQFAFVIGAIGAVAGPILTEWIPVSMEMGAVVFAGIGAATGAGAGAAYGWHYPRERWRWYVLPFGYDPNLRR